MSPIAGGSSAPPPMVMISNDEANGGGLGICCRLMEKITGNIILINNCARIKQYNPDIGD